MIITKEAKLSLESDAQIVLLMLGTNDSKQMNWNAKLYRESTRDSM